jgi:hypothetical protein
MPKPKPTWAEALVERLADQMYAGVQSIPEAEYPLGTVPLTRDEEMAQFARVRNDPAAYRQAIAGRPFHEVIAEDVRLERQYRAQMERNDAPTELDNGHDQGATRSR